MRECRIGSQETIDGDGWLHSGDLASADAEDFYYITGRLKELLITAGGENVAPVPIEDAIKEELPCVSNVQVVGDRKKFLSAFVTLRCVVDADTDTPTGRLAPTAKDWCRSVGRAEVETVDDILGGMDMHFYDEYKFSK